MCMIETTATSLYLLPSTQTEISTTAKFIEATSSCTVQRTMVEDDDEKVTSTTSVILGLSSTSATSTSSGSTTAVITSSKENSAVLSIELFNTNVGGGDGSSSTAENSPETSTILSYRSCHLVSFLPITKAAVITPPTDDDEDDDTSPKEVDENEDDEPNSSTSTVDDGGGDDDVRKKKKNRRNYRKRTRRELQQQDAPPPPERYIGEFQLSFEAAGYIAMKHLNERNNSIVSNLKELMDGGSHENDENVDECDIYFTYEMTDTQVNPFIALSDLQDVAAFRQMGDINVPPIPIPQPALEQQTESLNWTLPQMAISNSTSIFGVATPPPSKTKAKPIAIIGGAASSISQALANLGGVYQIPQVSGTSSASDLDDKHRAPYFSRVYPTNEADAKALMALYKNYWNVTHFGCIYSRDLYGISYGEAITRQAKQHNITVYSIAYEVNNYQSLYDALSYLQSTQVKYYFGIYHYESYKVAFQISYDLGIMGNKNGTNDNDTTSTWILSDNNSELTTKDFSLDVKTEYDIGQAIHGVGVLLTDFPQHPILNDILTTDFLYDTQLQYDFVQAHVSENIQEPCYNYHELLIMCQLPGIMRVTTNPTSFFLLYLEFTSFCLSLLPLSLSLSLVII